MLRWSLEKYVRCVRALSRAGAQALLLQTATRGELWLLHWIKSLSARIQQVSEPERGAAEGSGSQQQAELCTHCTTYASSPGTFCAEAEWIGKRRAVLGGGGDRRGFWEGPESPGELEDCQKGKTSLEGSQRHEIWGGDFLCIFRWTTRHASMAASLSAPYHHIQAFLQSLSGKRGFLMDHLHYIVQLQTPEVLIGPLVRCSYTDYITSPCKIIFVLRETLLVMIKAVLF